MVGKLKIKKMLEHLKKKIERCPYKGVALRCLLALMSLGAFVSISLLTIFSLIKIIYFNHSIISLFHLAQHKVVPPLLRI